MAEMKLLFAAWDCRGREVNAEMAQLFAAACLNLKIELLEKRKAEIDAILEDVRRIVEAPIDD